MTDTPKTYPVAFTVTPENFVEALEMFQNLIGRGDPVAFECSEIMWDLGMARYSDDYVFRQRRSGSTIVEALDVALTEKLNEWHKKQADSIKEAQLTQLRKEKESLRCEQQYDALSKTVSASQSLTEKVASLTAMKNFLQGNVSFKNRFNLVISSQTPETQEIWEGMWSSKEDE